MKNQGIKRLEITGCDTVHHSEDGKIIHIKIPVIFRRRGGKSRILTPDGQPLTPPREHPSPSLRDYTGLFKADSRRWQSTAITV